MPDLRRWCDRSVASCGHQYPRRRRPCRSQEGEHRHWSRHWGAGGATRLLRGFTSDEYDVPVDQVSPGVRCRPWIPGAWPSPDRPWRGPLGSVPRPERVHRREGRRPAHRRLRPRALVTHRQAARACRAIGSAASRPSLAWWCSRWTSTRTKALLPEWKIIQQSTLIAFKGKTETKQSGSETIPTPFERVPGGALAEPRTGTI